MRENAELKRAGHCHCHCYGLEWRAFGFMALLYWVI